MDMQLSAKIVLFAPLIDDQWMNTSRQGLDQTLDDLMLPVCAALGIARRDRELARQILMAHRRMVEAVTRKKRRPSLVQRQYFHDALVFLGLSVKARGGDGGELLHWQRLAAITRVPAEVFGVWDPNARSGEPAEPTLSSAWAARPSIGT